MRRAQDMYLIHIKLLFLVICVVCFSGCSLVYGINVKEFENGRQFVTMHMLGCEKYLPEIYVNKDDLSVWVYCPDENTKGVRLWKAGPTVNDEKEYYNGEYKRHPENIPQSFRSAQQVTMEKCGLSSLGSQMYCGEFPGAGYKFKFCKEGPMFKGGNQSRYFLSDLQYIGYDILPRAAPLHSIPVPPQSSPLPPNLIASIQFTDPSGNNILDAEETGKLIIILQNHGKGTAYDVKAEIKSDPKIKGLEFERQISIGTVQAGKIARKEIDLRAAEDISAANVTLLVVVKEANGFEPDPMKISFATKALEAPQLVIADIGVDDQKGGGRVEPNTVVDLTVRIQNIGLGIARDVTADVLVGKNVFVAGETGTRFNMGSISSGQFKDFKFSFYTNNKIANGENIPITVNLAEAHPKFNTSQIITSLVMNSYQKKIQEVVVKGEDTPRKADIKLAGGLTIDVDMNIPAGQKAGKFDVAVVIGNRNYAASGSPDVEFASRDAKTMRDYLIQTFGYDANNILYAEDATLTKFNEFFGSERDHRGRLFKYVKKDVSRVFVYYVGHGAPDLETTDAYFVPVDANPRDLKSNGYRLQTFYDNLAKIPAKGMTIVLDTCFSGNSEKGMIFKNISPALVKVKKEFQGPANAVVITSAAVDQVSTWYPEKKHSLFTYYFLKGLQGHADLNKDGEVTVGEMAQYLKDHVPYMARRLSGIEQSPVVIGNDADVLVVFKKAK